MKLVTESTLLLATCYHQRMSGICCFFGSNYAVCSLVVCHQRSGGTCCLHLEGDGIRHSAENNVGYRERVYSTTAPLCFLFFVLHRPLPYVLILCCEYKGSRFLRNFGYDLSDYPV